MEAPAEPQAAADGEPGTGSGETPAGPGAADPDEAGYEAPGGGPDSELRSAAAEDEPTEPEPAAAAESGRAGDGGPEAEPRAAAEPEVGESPAEPVAEAEAADPAKPALSEAAAELAAQRIERERIARRKAEREAPVDAGAKLSGKAADLLAAVRAVESGAKPPSGYFDEAPAPRRPAAPAPQPRTPVAPAAPAAVAPGAVEEVRAVLTRGGAPEALAAEAAAALGEGAAETLAENPWRLLSVAAVRPTQADGFARALLGPEAGPGDERRTGALVGWLLAQAALKGHTALEAPVLRSALAQYAVPDPAEALEAAIAEGAVLVFQEPLGQQGAEPAEGDAGEEEPVRILVGLEGAAMAEESLADGLARLANTFDAPADWEKAAGAAPSPSAAELIRTVAGHGLTAHIGGEAARAEPFALLAAAGELGLRTCLAAHAPGGPDSVTVAGLLSGAEGPGRDADGQFALDLLVVLDAPQLDVETAAALVESVPDGARLVLSGDPGVLGSAGAGRVFADVLAARACPQVVSRTPDPGPIGELVSGVGIGELNQVDAPGKEVVIVPVRDAAEAVHRTVQLVAESVPRAFGIPADSVQVITPGHGGSAGTRALNAALKERLNPGPGRFGGFDPGDRVVHVPSPGRAEPARVVSADAQGLHLDRAGVRVVVPKEQVESRVRHGWAVTAHQAVGARWPAVVVVLPGDAAQALSREWVYTAFGRAQRHLSVVHGVDQALPHAVAEVLPKPRTTRLTGLLKALVASAAQQPE
ncbi:helix-hairpin-helix domain-containing protein [Streptomyces sp. NBC_01408]|uniref:helix-hairpin-helix domain-containing protein n=1 Tax=Streptomyces sp. NBC_01408 TaxID=2903855 RepID=UPI002251B602|nr:helix-hairpin-helix domain-containing protein [Streptomyces sp. NBC_01408]MCX4694229.1 ATP-binding domain-containing protein [Streptomyces sp. NBC_01408]